ncbi:hypothetical protein [Qipengyuania zhejiangensis]|uniref:hypothetical protein n=1 Tax=Qipengyuania zhejiangensis TaxID=3077782 RepID=UPI002D782FB5|nr:hypothetical protein [Qipengyuania sp. Z2]
MMNDLARTGQPNWRIIGWAGLLALLLVPAIAMQFTREVAWGPGDFVVMGVLLAAVGLGVEAAVRLVRSPRNRLLVCAAIVMAFLLVWAELAVGIFN